MAPSRSFNASSAWSMSTGRCVTRLFHRQDINSANRPPRRARLPTSHLNAVKPNSCLQPRITPTEGASPQDSELSLESYLSTTQPATDQGPRQSEHATFESLPTEP